MTPTTPLLDALRAARLPHGVPRPARALLSVGAVLAVFALVAGSALAPPRPPNEAELLEAYIDENAQTVTVPESVAPPAVSRDAFSATAGVDTLVAGGTNHDWAKLVLLLAGFPMTETNVTVFTRWMRQENGPPDWWNRNNPLNNGWGAPGAGGTGTNANLVIAAENAAEALHSIPGYSGIVDAFAASAPTEVIEQAIWASPWASGHYAYGGHWAYTPVPVIKAPAEAWGQ